MTTTTAAVASKTIEQLQLEAAEAQKAIEALQQKQEEIRAAERAAAQIAETTKRHFDASMELCKQIEEHGTGMRMIVRSVDGPWQYVSSYREIEHGAENKALITSAEEGYGFMQYRMQIGKKTATIVARPVKDVSGKWSVRTKLEVCGAVRLIMRETREGDRTTTYKSFDNAPAKINKIIEAERAEQKRIAAKGDARAEHLRTIEEAAKKQFPGFNFVRASYMYLKNWNDRGHYESDSVRLDLGVTDSATSSRAYEHVQIDENGYLTAPVTRREVIEIK